MAVGIVLERAHVVSPIALAWSNFNARQKMISQWWKFILFPAVLLALSLWLGFSVGDTKAPMFSILVVVYFWWNIFHFAAQNYGVCLMLGYCKRWQTSLAMIATILPFVMFPFWGTSGLILANYANGLVHWLTDWALCSWASRRWVMFGGLTLIVGLSGLFFKDVGTCENAVGVCLWQIADPRLLSFMYGIGFVHFLYSRWDWQRGRELFA